MRLKWTLSAINDLSSIREFIARDSNIYADSFIDKIFLAAVHGSREINNLPIKPWDIV
jgi:plasmid stabilization system protein ParE